MVLQHGQRVLRSELVSVIETKVKTVLSIISLSRQKPSVFSYRVMLSSPMSGTLGETLGTSSRRS